MINVNMESKHQMTDSKIINEYIHGGKGVVCLEAPSGKCHYYMFQRPYNSEAFPYDIIFIYAVHDFTKKFYIGKIEKGQFRMTSRSRFHPSTEIVKGAKFIVRMAHYQQLVDNTPMKLYHMGICARCGRPLTDSKCIELGFGKRCRKNLESDKEKGNAAEEGV